MTRWEGDPYPGDELDPEWFDLDDVPLGEDGDDARHWFRRVLDGGHAAAEFAFAAELATVSERRSIPVGKA